jgi:hypothetical protein
MVRTPVLCPHGHRPTVCLSHDASRVLLYQELPRSIPCGEARTRRRKDDRRVGLVSRGTVPRVDNKGTHLLSKLSDSIGEILYGG